MLAVIIPTYKCNLRCKHCLRTQYKEGDLELDDLMMFLSALKKYRLGKNFSLSGGEPTICRNISEILSVLRKESFRGNIVSNGQDKEGVSKIIQFSDIISYVLISLEGARSSIHDKIRGEGSFQRAVESIKNYKKNNIKVYVRITLNKINAGYLEEMFDFLELYGIDRLSITTIQPCINEKRNNLSITQEELKKTYKEYLTLITKYPKIRSSFNRRNIRELTSAEWPIDYCRPMNKKEGELTLNPNGDISFCCDLADFGYRREEYGKKSNFDKSHILGNIRNDGFDIIIKRKEDIANALFLRRKSDYIKGNLKGSRQFICQNCKFYFYEK